MAKDDVARMFALSAALAAAKKNDVKIEQTGLVELPLEETSTTIKESLFLVSHTAPTYAQLIGGKIVLDDGAGAYIEIPLTAENVVDISSQVGQTGYMIMYGEDGRDPLLYVFYDVSEIVPAIGVYATDEVVEEYLPYMTFFINGESTVFATPHASFHGTADMEAGLSDLPNDVLYMQTNSAGTEVKNVYLGVNGKAAKLELNPEIVNVVFTQDSGSAECSHTFDEIKSAYEAGKDVRFYYTESWTSGGGGSAKVELAMDAYYHGSTLTYFVGRATNAAYDELNQSIKLNSYVYCNIPATGNMIIEARGISPVG